MMSGKSGYHFSSRNTSAINLMLPHTEVLNPPRELISHDYQH